MLLVFHIWYWCATHRVRARKWEWPGFRTGGSRAAVQDPCGSCMSSIKNGAPQPKLHTRWLLGIIARTIANKHSCRPDHQRDRTHCQCQAAQIVSTATQLVYCSEACGCLAAVPSFASWCLCCFSCESTQLNDELVALRAVYRPFTGECH